MAVRWGYNPETLEGLPNNARLDAVQPETLARRMTSGPLPLGYALQCATDIAHSLRALHGEGLMHGSVDASSVIVTSAGAQLLPPNGLTRYTAPGTDVSAFGALLYEMLTGSKPSTRSAQPLPPIASRNTEEGIRIAATRLASKCLQSTSNTFSEMQKVLTEVRLLSLQTRIRVKPACLPPVAAIPERTRHTAFTAKPSQPTYVPPEGLVVHRIFTAVPADGFMGSSGIDYEDALPTGVKCPVCGVAYVYPSRPRNWFETMLSGWGSPTLRCHRCLYRYVIVMGRFKFAKGSPLKANRKSQIR
jgi:hypothetical protein